VLDKTAQVGPGELKNSGELNAWVAETTVFFNLPGSSSWFVEGVRGHS